MLSRIGRGLGRFARFLAQVLARFEADGCLAAAGALSYTTLVSLVPLLAISLAVLSAFPIFDRLRDQTLDLIFNAFVPRIGGEVELYIGRFVASAGRTTALGVAVLAVTAVMLLATIESRLDAIWRVHAPRSWPMRVVIYWTLLTLGPLLFGLALSLTARLHGYGQALGLSEATLGAREIGLFAPVALQTVGLMLLYCLIPHCPVRWRDGLIGAVAASLLLELFKAGFSFYLDHVNAYEAVYGALAAIPIFLLWMYLSWAVVLFGAEIAAALPLWAADEPAEARAARELELAVAVLAALYHARSAVPAAVLGTTELARAAASGPAETEEVLSRLAAAGLVARTADRSWVLCVEPAVLPLGTVHQALGHRDAPGRWREGSWLAAAFVPLRSAEQDLLARTIGSLIGRPDPGSPEPTVSDQPAD